MPTPVARSHVRKFAETQLVVREPDDDDDVAAAVEDDDDEEDDEEEEEEESLKEHDQEDDAEKAYFADEPEVDDREEEDKAARRRTLMFIACCCCCLLIIAIVLLILFLTGGDDDKSTSSTAPSMAPSVNDTMVPSAAPSVFEEEIVFPAVSDTYIQGGALADQQFGTAETFEVVDGEGDDNKAIALLLFNMSNITSDSAFEDSQILLRLMHVESVNSETSAISVSKLPFDSTVDVEGLTWNDFSNTEGEAGPEFTVVEDSEEIDVDVTSLVRPARKLRQGRRLQSDGMLFLKLEATNNTDHFGEVFRSREFNDGEFAPKLILHRDRATPSNSSPPPTSPPTVAPVTPPTFSPAPSASPSLSAGPTLSMAPSLSAAPSGAPSSSAPPSITASESPSQSFSPTAMPTSSPAPTRTFTPSSMPSVSNTPTTTYSPSQSPSSSSFPSTQPTDLITCGDAPCGLRAYCVEAEGTKQVSCECFDFTPVDFGIACPEGMGGESLCDDVQCTGIDAVCLEEFDLNRNPVRAYCICPDDTPVDEDEDCPGTNSTSTAT